MSLTGVPLILLALLATAGTAAATVRLWHAPGRWRYPVRVAGVLLAEALVVASVGLVANRAEQFYPSWAALGGHTGTALSTSSRAAGRLDRALQSSHGGAVPWRPRVAAAWRLTATPTVIVPAGYAARPTVAFPVVLDLCGGRARVEPDTVTVVLAPSRRTGVAALASLAPALGRDVRVTAGGWAIVATARQARLAAGLMHAEAGRFATLAVVGHRPAGDSGGVVRSVAAGLVWAAGHIGPALAAPARLPSATATNLAVRRPGHR